MRCYSDPKARRSKTAAAINPAMRYDPEQGCAAMRENKIFGPHKNDGSPGHAGLKGNCRMHTTRLYGLRKLVPA